MVTWTRNGLGQATRKTEAADAGEASPTNSYARDDAGRLIEEKRIGYAASRSTKSATKGWLI